ncbi:hypothetical protein [Planctomicrobium sp. SH664]|uniref:hypothetical protein n=1 Tax=Planctomicrobium sp. SH664 TaxID=3448125 RepID=UPI003F5B8ED6
MSDAEHHRTRFHDSTGESWFVSLSYSQLVAVKRRTGIVVVDLVDTQSASSERFRCEFVQFEVLCELLREQLRDRRLTESEFAARMQRGETCEAANQCILWAIVEFFPEQREPSHRRRRDRVKSRQRSDAAELCLQLAGILGIDPGPRSLRELVVMVSARRDEEWAHTAWVAMWVANSNPYLVRPNFDGSNAGWTRFPATGSHASKMQSPVASHDGDTTYIQSPDKSTASLFTVLQNLPSDLDVAGIRSLHVTFAAKRVISGVSGEPDDVAISLQLYRADQTTAMSSESVALMIRSDDYRVYGATFNLQGQHLQLNDWSNVRLRLRPQYFQREGADTTVQIRITALEVTFTHEPPCCITGNLQSWHNALIVCDSDTGKLIWAERSTLPSGATGIRVGTPFSDRIGIQTGSQYYTRTPAGNRSSRTSILVPTAATVPHGGQPLEDQVAVYPSSTAGSGFRFTRSDGTSYSVSYGETVVGASQPAERIRGTCVVDDHFYALYSSLNPSGLGSVGALDYRWHRANFTGHTLESASYNGESHVQVDGEDPATHTLANVAKQSHAGRGRFHHDGTAAYLIGKFFRRYTQTHSSWTKTSGRTNLWEVSFTDVGVPTGSIYGSVFPGTFKPRTILDDANGGSALSAWNGDLASMDTNPALKNSFKIEDTDHSDPSATKKLIVRTFDDRPADSDLIHHMWYRYPRVIRLPGAMADYTYDDVEWMTDLPFETAPATPPTLTTTPLRARLNGNTDSIIALRDGRLTRLAKSNGTIEWSVGVIGGGVPLPQSILHRDLLPAAS